MSVNSQSQLAHVIQMPGVQQALERDFQRFDYVRDVRFAEEDKDCGVTEFAVVMEDNPSEYRTGDFKIELNVDNELDHVTVEFARPGQKMRDGTVKVIFNLKHATPADKKTAQWGEDDDVVNGAMGQ